MRIFRWILFSLLIAYISTFTNLVFAQYNVSIAFPNLTFDQPLDLQTPRDGTNRLFVVEKGGRVYVFINDYDVTQKKLFLDIRDRVDDSGSEMGLLGLAFHPDYVNNGYFYVDYTAGSPRRTIVARYEVSAGDPNLANTNSEFILLEVLQPNTNHNAGQLFFDDAGYFYITLGDGGSGYENQLNGQNPATLLGSILRINIDDPEPGKTYSIPTENPFVGKGEGYREEIFAYGFRNPWRVSFDSETNRIWCGDVGQNDYEEINIVEKGRNYGWRTMEGFHCFESATCDTSGLTLPIWEYEHDIGRSITGGYVYRGNRMPELVGHYIYADYVNGIVWALDYKENGEITNILLQDTQLKIPSFGLDHENEIYICAFDGKIYSLGRMGIGIPDSPVEIDREFRLFQNYPNPFNNSTMISFHLEQEASISLQIYDMNGRLVDTVWKGNRSAGNHILMWDGQDANNRSVVSAVYIYRLSIGSLSQVRKMVYLR